MFSLWQCPYLWLHLALVLAAPMFKAYTHICCCHLYVQFLLPYSVKTLVLKSLSSSATKLSSVPIHSTYLIIWLLRFLILISVTPPSFHLSFLLPWFHFEIVLSGNRLNAKYPKLKKNYLMITAFYPFLFTSVVTLQLFLDGCVSLFL